MAVVEFKFLAGLREVIKGSFQHILLVVAIFSIGAFNFSFILLNAREMGVADAYIPIIYAIVNVAHTAIAIPVGILSDWIGRERILIIGYGFFLITTIFISLSQLSIAATYLIAVLFGFYMGTVETIQRALVPSYASEGLIGTAYGVYYLVMGSALFIANSIVGTLWEFYGHSAASIYSIASTSLAIALMILFLKSRKYGADV